jgi:hypothetical protein
VLLSNFREPRKGRNTQLRSGLVYGFWVIGHREFAS